jgi:hypothetical protein
MKNNIKYEQLLHLLIRQPLGPSSKNDGKHPITFQVLGEAIEMPKTIVR